MVVRFSCGALLLVALLFLESCSLPRIFILKDPLTTEEHNKLGEIYASQGKDDLAAQQYQEALEKDPDSVSTLLLLGDLSFRREKYPDAEAAYKKAIQLRSRNGDVYNNLCWVYLQQNVKAEACEDLIRTAITLTPEHRGYYLDTLGVSFLRMGRTGESIAALQEAIELLPGDNAEIMSEVNIHLSESYDAAGESGKALEARQAAARYRSGK